MAHAQNVTYAVPGLTARLQGLWADYKESRILRAKYNQTVRELSQMSDRDLADIGISRWQIDEIAREHAYGK